MSESLELIELGVRSVLGDVVADVDPLALPLNLNLWDQLDIDANDLKAFASGLSETFGVDIPETEFPKLTTLMSWTVYIDNALGKSHRL